MVDHAAILPPGPLSSGPAQEPSSKKSDSHPTVAQETTPVPKITSAKTASAAPTTAVKKVIEPMPYVESAFHKVPKKAVVKRTPVPKKTAANDTPTAPTPAVKKVIEPMPYVASAFRKAPPLKATRKPRAKKAAPKPEPAPAPKKFMTEKGAAFFKALEGDSSSMDYDKFFTAPKNKRTNPETEASIAKKLKLKPVQPANPDLEPHRLEKESVQDNLIGDSFLFLVCQDKEMIRGDKLRLLQYQYRAFAIIEVRADTTGYFMVFEKTVSGDRDLKKCWG